MISYLELDDKLFTSHTGYSLLINHIINLNFESSKPYEIDLSLSKHKAFDKFVRFLL